MHATHRWDSFGSSFSRAQALGANICFYQFRSCLLSHTIDLWRSALAAQSSSCINLVIDEIVQGDLHPVSGTPMTITMRARENVLCVFVDIFFAGLMLAQEAKEARLNERTL